jgi:lipid A 3-O-deacylase
MSRSRARILLSLLWLSATAAAVRAEEALPPANPRGVFTGITENDLYAPHNKDRHYTNGIQFGWMSADDDVPGWARSLAGLDPLLDSDGRQRIGWVFGQEMFTPEDKSTPTPILTDRPYAAWLYGGLKLQSESARRLDTVELDLGMVGPAAFGEQVQSHWHGLIGAQPAHGWANQIKNEPGIDLTAERLWRIPLGGLDGDLSADVIPNVEVSLGNVMTYGGAGGTFRFGEQLASDFGPARQRPSVPGSDSFRMPAGFGWYVFAGGEARAIGHNIFLDGNTFANSQSVSTKPFVADVQGGLALLYKRARLTYTQMMRTKEFDGQHHPDYLGSLALSIAF